MHSGPSHLWCVNTSVTSPHTPQAAPDKCDGCGNARVRKVSESMKAACRRSGDGAAALKSRSSSAYRGLEGNGKDYECTGLGLDGDEEG
jgi:hypothetical protein